MRSNLVVIADFRSLFAVLFPKQIFVCDETVKP